MVGELSLHDSRLKFGSLKHGPEGRLDITCATNRKSFSVGFRPESGSLMLNLRIVYFDP
jgi:hypothetical protein